MESKYNNPCVTDLFGYSGESCRNHHFGFGKKADTYTSAPFNYDEWVSFTSDTPSADAEILYASLFTESHVVTHWKMGRALDQRV